MSPTTFEGVRDVLVDALGVDDDDVTPEAVLGKDLGAESIDALDITYRLEKIFRITMPMQEVADSFRKYAEAADAHDLQIFVCSSVQDVVNYVDAKLRGVTQFAPVKPVLKPPVENRKERWLE
jgi:acyl carrier protein